MKELLIFHASSEYLEDVKSLQRYIQSELNVRDIIFTSDEERSGVRYRASADWPTLGKKLRKDLAKVKNALPSLSSEAVKNYDSTGLVKVDGIELVAGDLIVSRYIDLPPNGTFGTDTDNDVVVLLDIQVHPELVGEWLSRELVNRVQKLRKKANLQATDDIEVYYVFEEGSGEQLKEALVSQHDFISRTIRNVPQEGSLRPASQTVIIEEEQEIADTKFTLTLASR